MSEAIETSTMTKKKPKQQLSKAMEHMRGVVTDPLEPPNNGIEDSTTSLDSLHISSDPTEQSAYGVPTTYQPLRKATTSSSSNPNKRSDPFQFGSRFLEEGDDIFSHNAWDHVETDSSYQDFILEQTDLQRSNPVNDFDKARFNDKPEKWWDKFYSHNKANFFKDRKWLGQEFPLLKDVTRSDYGKVTILEVGAGAGNTAFPIMKMNENEELKLYACDYSRTAVDVMKNSQLYNDKEGKGVMIADRWDVTGQGEESTPSGLEKESVNVIIMIFIFSALAPSQWKQALINIWNLLKPGGTVLFRDYGRGDLAQVRFKKGRYLEENFYIRGDGTRVYFFEKDQLENIWSGKDFEGEEEDNAIPKFDIVNIGVDRRMIVNRQRRLKMYRCWMQGLFQKPESTVIEDNNVVNII